jgi:hypothetical protein
LFFADAKTGFNCKERKARADEKLAASFTSLPSVKLLQKKTEDACQSRKKLRLLEAQFL